MSGPEPLDDSRLGQRFLRGSFYLGPGIWLTYVVNFALSLMLARILGPEAFGFYAFVFAVNEFLNIITGFSIEVAVLRAREESQELYDTAFVLSAGLGGAALLGALVAAPLLVSQRGAEAGWFIVALGVFRILTLLAGIHRVRLERQFRFGTVAGLNLASGILPNVAAVLCAWFGAGVWSLLARDGATACLLLSLGYLVSGYRFRSGYRRAVVSEIMDFAKPMFVARMVETVSLRSDRIVVGALLGNRALGLYDRSMFLAETGQLAARPLGQLVLNLYSRLQDQPRRLARSYEVVNFFLVRVMGAGAIVLVIFPEPTIRLLLGQDFLAAAPVLRWLGFYAWLLPVAENMKSMLLALGRVRFHARTRIIQMCVLIPGVLVAALHGSADGVAGVLVGSWLLWLGIAYIALRELAGSLRSLFLVPVLVATVTVGAIAAGARAGLLAGMPFWLLPFVPPLLFALLLALVERGRLLTELRFLRSQLRGA
jgi:PST family polysaccharide transporter